MSDDRSAARSSDELEVVPFSGTLDAVAAVPGSKSVTNRALVCAALAEGDTELEGVLFADDTEAMWRCLHDLGTGVRLDRDRRSVRVTGMSGTPAGPGALLDASLSGTTSRFVMPVAALGHGTVVLDGEPPLRGRPMGDLVAALDALGARIEPLGEPGHLPLRIDADGLRGGEISVRGDVSSQFLSALLLSAPCMDDGLTVEVSTALVSVPYVEMTVRVMESFGAHVSVEDGYRRISVAPTGYRAVERYEVEPDASAASYFFAAAALLGGRVRVEGLGTDSLQGDVRFVDVLERMGAEVVRAPRWTEVRGTGALHGIEADLSDISDTAQTLAAIAPFADSPTTITGIGFIRAKETDRVGAIVTELRRLGIDAEELSDGVRIQPGTPGPATVFTYRDHRMAMSFALVGLRAAGVRIADPGCVAKTFPGYWSTLGRLLGRPVDRGA